MSPGEQRSYREREKKHNRNIRRNNEQKGKGKKEVWFAGIVLMMLGVLLLYMTIPDFVQGYNSRNWPPTEGVISTAKVGKHRSGGRHPGIYYSPEISYVYKVAGVSYSGDRIALLGPGISEQEAQMVVNRYPPGKKVSVFYDSNDPKTAALEPGLSGWTCLNLGTGVLSVPFGLGLIVRAKRRSQQQPAPSASSQLRQHH